MQTRKRVVYEQTSLRLYPVEQTALFRAFCPVAAAGLTTFLNAQGIQHTADNFVSNPWQVANTTTANEHDGVLLQVVPFPGDVSGQFLAVGQPDTADFPQRRVRFLRRHGTNLQADAPLLRSPFQQRSFRLRSLLFAWLADQLVDCRHGTVRRVSTVQKCSKHSTKSPPRCRESRTLIRTTGRVKRLADQQTDARSDSLEIIRHPRRRFSVSVAWIRLKNLPNHFHHRQLQQCFHQMGRRPLQSMADPLFSNRDS